LTKATVAAAESATDTAGATTTTDPGKATGGQTFRLIANPTALSPHVGKKLALTGTIEKAGSSPASTATETAADAKMPALRVESGKIVAASCDEQ